MVYGNCCEPRVFYWHGDHAKVDRLVDYRLQGLRGFRALNAHRDLWVLPFKISKYLGKYVEASSFIGPVNDLPTWRALPFRERWLHRLQRPDCLFGIRLNC